MALAHEAGIQVFATGGLGGVHRGGENTMDISADLTELGRTPMVVVSSGCKSFLDIPRTLEYLETQGVGVMTFADGREGEVDFPAFWTRDSGVKSPFTLKDEKEAASILCKLHFRGHDIVDSLLFTAIGRCRCTDLCIDAQRAIPVETGMLFANPVPAAHSIPKIEMDEIISQALKDAVVANSYGSENTPFVLNRIREITQGGSVTANRALVESNVARGTKVAVELSKLSGQQSKG